MNIKLICSDIDGTLIGDGRKGIPQINKEMLQKATRMGIRVALVSGRGPGGILPLQKACGITGPMGCFSGALVRDEKGTKLAGNPLDKQLALSVLAEIRRFPEVTVFQFGEEARYKEKQGRWEEFEGEVSCQGVRYPSLEASLKDPETTAYKLLAITADKAVMEALRASLAKDYGDTLQVMQSSPYYLEIQQKGIGKGTAVKVLCDHYRIAAEAVVAFGDYYNDLDMFHAAGLSVAMGGAPDDVKREATRVSGPSAQGGLGSMLKELLA